MTDRIFEIRHLQKQFGDHQVLNDVNLSVERGEVVSIIGSSGVHVVIQIELLKHHADLGTVAVKRRDLRLYVLALVKNFARCGSFEQVYAAQERAFA